MAAPLTCSTPTVTGSTPTAIAAGGCVRPSLVRIAIVGDYGTCTEFPAQCEIEAAIARAILRDNPDFVIAVGDLNYNNGNAGPNVFPPPSGSGPAHISQNNLRVFPLSVFSDMSTLPPPKPAGTPAVLAFPPEPPDASNGVELYEAFIDSGRFFPTWGNHEYHQANATPAKSFFGKSIPYVVEAGPFAVVAVDSNQVAFGATDPDPSVHGSAPGLDDQVAAVVEALAGSDACWKAVFMHHPAVHNTLSENTHPTTDAAVINFINAVNAELTNPLDFVFSGHVHALELAERQGTHFVLSGSGGRSPSDALDDPEHDATRVAQADDEADNGYILIQFLSKPQALSSTAHVMFKLVAKSDGSATPWHDRWMTSQEQVLLATKEACENPGCSQAGTCGTGATPTPIATYRATDVVPHSMCDQIPATCDCQHDPPTGCGSLHWLYVGRPTCGSSPNGTPMPRYGDNLMRVKVTAPACGVSVCTLACCPVRAVARNQLGITTGWVCLEPVLGQFGQLLAYEGISGCIFDSLTAPTVWRLESQHSSCPTACSGNGYELKVEYFCCGCSSIYEG